MRDRLGWADEPFKVVCSKTAATSFSALGVLECFFLQDRELKGFQQLDSSEMIFS